VHFRATHNCWCGISAGEKGAHGKDGGDFQHHVYVKVTIPSDKQEVIKHIRISVQAARGTNQM
jgi:hypothetical protein